MYDVIAEEDKPVFHRKFMSMTEMRPDLSPGNCCGVVCRDRHRSHIYNKYIHTFFSPTDIIVENQKRQTLVIPDIAGNLTFEWDDV